MIAAHTIRTRLEEFAVAVTDRHFAAHPEVLERYGEIGRTRCLEDARFHLQYLATALDAEAPQMFLEYIGWAKVMLARRHVPATDLADNLEIIAGVLEEHHRAVEYLRMAIDELPSMADDVPSLLDPRAPAWDVASAYLSALLATDRRGALDIINHALDAGTSVRELYRHVFEPVQQEIGRLWQLNQISVAQEHFCTAATQHVMTQLYGRIFSREQKRKEGARAVAMCVGGELHEVGLRIVTDVLELEGWQTWYLGASMPPAAAVQLCVEQHATVLLVSATLPPHLERVEEVIRIFRSRPELADAKIVVGGRAFRAAPDLWRTIGADGYAVNADDCLALLERIHAR